MLTCILLLGVVDNEIKGGRDESTRLSKWGVTAIAATVLGAQAMGQEATSTGCTPAQAHGSMKRVIVVSLEDRKLALVEDGKVKKVYTVAVGKPSTPSPVGTYTIERRVRESRLTRMMARRFRRGRAIRWARGGWG